MSVRDFYDGLAESYHLIFENWDQSMARQAGALDGILQQRWGLGGCTLLDAAVGIGTQSLGLAARDYGVIGADISARAVARARREAARRRLALPLVSLTFATCLSQVLPWTLSSRATMPFRTCCR